jgi:Resolvase, N terminal domain
MQSNNHHGPRKAVLYARVSTDEQAKSGYSLAQQIEALRAYTAREGYEVLEEVTDPGQSGASLERPGMDRVRDLVAAGGVSVVLAQDRDHFAREPAYHYLLKREFAEYGTKLKRSMIGVTRALRVNLPTVSWISWPSTREPRRRSALDAGGCVGRGRARSSAGTPPTMASFTTPPATTT